MLMGRGTQVALQRGCDRARAARMKGWKAFCKACPAPERCRCSAQHQSEVELCFRYYYLYCYDSPFLLYFGLLTHVRARA